MRSIYLTRIIIIYLATFPTQASLSHTKLSLTRCNPLPDFGGCHTDPDLTCAADLVPKIGLNPNESLSMLPTLGAANDRDRNLIAGAWCFVTLFDPVAIILAHY